ncbi:MAG: hypothetical protein AB8B54_07035 [Sphingorhabdus sp.]
MTHPVSDASATTDKRASFDIDQAHVLRSKIIGKCADVECWLVDRIQPYQKPSPSFSMKVKQFEEILQKHKDEFNKPEKLQSHLAGFHSFAGFRSEIAHSNLNLIETTGHKTLITFQNAAFGSNELEAKSIILSSQELQSIWKKMCTAAQKITNYKITPAS